MDRATQDARDDWIVLRCQSGEAQAFADLVRTFERPLLYYATKLLADETAALDVLQEVWLKAFGGIRRLAHPRALQAWLYRLAHGLSVDRLRRDRSVRRAEQVRADQVPEAIEEDPDDPFDADAPTLHRLLDLLPVHHREVLVLHFLEDLSVAEVAEVVGCPPGTGQVATAPRQACPAQIALREGHGTESR